MPTKTCILSKFDDMTLEGEKKQKTTSHILLLHSSIWGDQETLHIGRPQTVESPEHDSITSDAG